MTTYTAIADADIDPESPINTTLMTRMRDNPIAITEGSAGAPKIQTTAIQDDAVTGDKIQSPAAGSTIVLHALGDTGITTTSTSYITSVDYTTRDVSRSIPIHILVAGTVRVSVDQRVFDAGGTSTVRILKNGALVNSWSMTGVISFVTRTEDVAVAVGDVITVQQITDNATYRVVWKNIKILSGNSTFAAG